MKYLLLIFLFTYNLYGQYRETSQRLAFADYLFCSEDYLRAAEEYDIILQNSNSDSIIIKSGLSYFRIKDYVQAVNFFSKISEESNLSFYAYEKEMVSHFLSGDFHKIKFNNSNNIIKLFSYSLLKRDYIPEKNLFLRPFEEVEKEEAEKFYELKVNPPVKSGTLAALLSVVIPGAGKIYTNRVSDGITSLIATSLLGYLTYTNFKADHKVRGYIFAGLTSFFYAGNIYGSYLSANIYNQKLFDDFNLNLNVYLEGKNYFVKDPQFCK